MKRITRNSSKTAVISNNKKMPPTPEKTYYTKNKIKKNKGLVKSSSTQNVPLTSPIASDLIQEEQQSVSISNTAITTNFMTPQSTPKKSPNKPLPSVQTPREEIQELEAEESSEDIEELEDASSSEETEESEEEEDFGHRIPIIFQSKDLNGIGKGVKFTEDELREYKITEEANSTLLKNEKKYDQKKLINRTLLYIIPFPELSEEEYNLLLKTKPRKKNKQKSIIHNQRQYGKSFSDFRFIYDPEKDEGYAEYSKQITYLKKSTLRHMLRDIKIHQKDNKYNYKIKLMAFTLPTNAAQLFTLQRIIEGLTPHDIIRLNSHGNNGLIAVPPLCLDSELVLRTLRLLHITTLKKGLNLFLWACNTGFDSENSITGELTNKLKTIYKIEHPIVIGLAGYLYSTTKKFVMRNCYDEQGKVILNSKGEPKRLPVQADSQFLACFTPSSKIVFSFATPPCKKGKRKNYYNQKSSIHSIFKNINRRNSLYFRSTPLKAGSTKGENVDSELSNTPLKAKK